MKVEFSGVAEIDLEESAKYHNIQRPSDTRVKPTELFANNTFRIYTFNN